MVIDQCNAYRHGGNPLYLGPEIFLSAKGLFGTSNFVFGWKADLILHLSPLESRGSRSAKTAEKKRESIFYEEIGTIWHSDSAPQEGRHPAPRDAARAIGSIVYEHLRRKKINVGRPTRGACRSRFQRLIGRPTAE